MSLSVIDLVARTPAFYEDTRMRYVKISFTILLSLNSLSHCWRKYPHHLLFYWTLFGEGNIFSLLMSIDRHTIDHFEND